MGITKLNNALETCSDVTHLLIVVVESQKIKKSLVGYIKSNRFKSGKVRDIV